MDTYIGLIHWVAVGNALYVLDLGETYKFLKNLSEYNGNSKSTFLEFIDRRSFESTIRRSMNSRKVDLELPLYSLRFFRNL
jgi:hypothetical protein